MAEAFKATFLLLAEVLAANLSAEYLRQRSEHVFVDWVAEAFKATFLLLAEVLEANCLPSTSGNEVSMFFCLAHPVAEAPEATFTTVG